MSIVTERVSSYVRNKGISIKKIARDTGIAYMALYDSLANQGRNRELRDEEFLKICLFLDIDPRRFADKPEQETTA